MRQVRKMQHAPRPAPHGLRPNRTWLGAAALLLSTLAASGQIVINEIMYHPYEPWPPTQPAKTTNASEYIELYNAGTSAVDLSEYRFDNGVDFVFPAGTVIPAGGYLVVCGNTAAFTGYYPAVTNFIGEFQGGLANDGERVTLSRAVGSDWVTVDTIAYYDGGPADGGGPSLELIHPGFAPLRDQYTGDWLPSLTTNGTPGRSNSVYTTAPLPVVGDVAHTPALPPAGSAVKVSARVRGKNGDALDAVQLLYRKDAVPQNAWTNTPMNDNGADGDAVAGDGVYTAWLPPYGQPAFTNGELAEYRIAATDASGTRVFPITNLAGATSIGYSYYCKFGLDTFADCAYPGEYFTMHLLMTASNLAALTNDIAAQKAVNQDCTFFADATIVTSDGDLFHGASVRGRGGTSRSTDYGGFRVELPPGMRIFGLESINLNHYNALRQHIGMQTFGAACGKYTFESRLARVYVNEVLKLPNQGIYMFFEAFDDDMIERRYTDSPVLGNRYAADGDWRTGYLEYLGEDPNLYTNKYYLDLNNPYTAWKEMRDLCRTLNEPLTNYPAVLTNRVNVRQWARHFAAQTCLDNQEAGFGSTTSVYGDELRLYANPADGRFDLYPWDLDAVIGNGARLWTRGTGAAANLVMKFLFNRPIVPWYAGDVRDIMTGAMSHESMSALFDAMGSKMAGSSASYLSTLTSQRNALLAMLNTNFTVNLNGAAPGFPVSLVPPLTVETAYVLNDVNQRTNAWIPLGSYEFSAAGGEYVAVTRVIDSAASGTVANAVMFSNAFATVLVGRSDTNRYLEFGTWVTTRGSSPTNSDVPIRLTTELGASARWYPALPTGGVYHVYAAGCSAYGTRPPFGSPSDPAARYTVVAQQSHPLLNLAGTAPQGYTDRILINGLATTIWSNQSSAWSASNGLVVTKPLDNVRIEAVDPDGKVLQALDLPIVAYRNPVFKSGTVAADTTWSNASGIVVVPSDVTVTSGARLTIAPSSIVAVATGARITIASGTLDIQGQPDRPVFLCASNSHFFVEAAGAGALVTGRWFTAAGAVFSASAGGRLALEDAVLTNAPAGRPAVSAAAAAGVSLNRCIVSDYSSLSFTATPVRVEQCLLERMARCGVEVVNASTALVARTTIRQSAGNGAADGVRFVNSPAGLATNCLIHGLSGAGASFVSSGAALAGSLVYQCATGIVVQGAAATNAHNTVSGCPVLLGGVLSDTRSSIFWAATNAVLAGPPTVAYCDVQLLGTNLYPGPGNLNRNPWFRNPAEGDYRLADTSPCRDAAEDGGDMGAAYPVGACPAAPSALTVTNLSDSVLVLHWQDNSDDESRFEIERLAPEGVWTVLTNLPASVTAWTNSGLVEDTAYRYRVRAAHNRGRSLPSEDAEATTSRSTTTQLLIDSLRFTEIMYNPSPGNSAAQAYEFLELQNVGDSVLNLTGLYFSAGLTYAFPSGATLAPGAFWLLVKDPAAFAARYPARPWSGVYTGSLDSAGERLRIKDAAGNSILDVTYQSGSAGDWYPSADGNGYSLVLLDPDGNMSAPGAWRPSANVHGSPGQVDPDPGYGNVVINEVLSHQDQENPGDWIELYNAGATTVNLTGWFLSDSPVNLRKFQLPTTVLPAGGYAVFTEYTHFGVARLGTNGFALSELGDEVYLSSATNGVLTGYRAWVKFGAAERDVTFGRYVRSDGEPDFTALSSQTPGASNSYPLISPVVINEIMYNPSAGGKEFVEIYNRTGAAVPLFDPAYPTNTWQFDAAFEYTFPTNTWLGPHEHALVVSIDPATFRSLFGLTGSTVQVFGPFDGALNNGGETIKLYRPGPPDLDGTVPRLLADRVQYDDDPPWPKAADNGGPSLERIAADRYGNDPTNWAAGTWGGTPGASNNVAGLPSVAFADPNGRSFENASTVWVAVALSPASSATVTVQYAVTGGTAVNGADYALPAGTLVFWPNDTRQDIPLILFSDGSPEPDETVEITLTSVSANARLGGNVQYTHTIVDTNPAALAAPGIAPAGATVFTNRVLVTLTPSVSGSTIRYTTDGTRPEFDDPVYTGPFYLDRSALLTARTFLGSYNAGAWTDALFLAQAPPAGWTPPVTPSNVVEVPVAASSDDAEEQSRPGHPVTTTRTVVSFGTNYYAASGFRFAGVGIPPGKTITNAYVQFTSAADGAGTVALRIYGQNADQAAAFATAGSNITSRPRTTNSVVWNPPAWSASSRGSAQRTPDLSAILQEIVSRPGWALSNALAVIVMYEPSSGAREARTYDGDPAQVAVLRAEWQEDAPSNFWFAVATNGNGTVAGGNRWVPAGSNAVAEATPGRLYRFAGWSGDVGGASTSAPILTVLMDRDRSVTAHFAPEPPTILGEEWQPDVFRFQWLSVTEGVYSIYRTPDLLSGWPAQPLAAGIPGDPTGTNRFEDSTATNPAAFYRIDMRVP